MDLARATPQTTNLSSKNRGWENILVEQHQHPPGEASCHYPHEHTIYLSLASRPVVLQHTQAGKTYKGLYGKGDISISPVDVPFSCRWDADDRFLQICISATFMDSVAKENIDRDRLELIPQFRTRDSQIEAIGMMLLTELQQENMGSSLYVESLTNLLAVHLLRQYTTFKVNLGTYTGGLPQNQMMQVLEYIDSSLHEDIKLADLAALLDMSQFHFSHLFKQSMGIAPYQYLLQQRIERAKLLLKQSDRSIIEIAFDCGFSSHSHLSKQFRQWTGMTPKAYRVN
ncbi:AraC family transcriptional regulator [Calothrix sp. 336/3]|uniref:AraC family transcriptional regulator n=1 Tax=Calothrix sp. 336/3 TaxID=1337936 RepID=UPI0004E3C5E7|nr:AraC family transcriptional regulator [Calothrix sp. 336/3]AKG20895.1 AraC family transcriptional regulator [Calothrix sp. 336/3]